MSALIVTWLDGETEPKCAPNPDYPNGIDVDGSNGAKETRKTALPYPAKRCGVYMIRCPICGIKVIVTTAGRPDDPRSVTMPCFGGNGVLTAVRRRHSKQKDGGNI